MLMKALRQPRSADRSSLWSRPRIFRLERVPLNQEPIHFQTERRSFAFDARLRHVRLARLTRTHRLVGIGDAADCRSAMAMWSLGRRSVTSGSMTPPDPMGSSTATTLRRLSIFVDVHSREMRNATAVRRGWSSFRQPAVKDRPPRP